ncbi:MAG: ClpXP protease specificity-enhancing factor [Gammaproteobacteria bacterium]|nr:ClpXP protease specificity-enhancing factor [Gammaproteobacteria bacterium]
MNSNRPYLLRALNEWIIDNEMTPHLLIDADFPGVSVPQEFIQDGKIVLNISPTAVNNLFIDNDSVSFSARFAGVSTNIYLPVGAVSAIYAKENGHGMIFPEDTQESIEQEDKTLRSDKRPDLKIVK